MLLLLLSVVAGLGPEVPLAPADNPAASQRFVRLAQSSGHTLAVWSDGQLRGVLDGVPLDLPSAGTPLGIIGVAGGSRSFLVAYVIQTATFTTPVLALRVGFDRRVLNPVPLTVDADTHGFWNGNVAFDGNDFVIVTMEKHATQSILPPDTIVTGRVSEDGVSLGNLRLTSSASSGKPIWPRIAWASDHFVIGYSATFFNSEGISGFAVSGFMMPPDASGNALLSDSQFPNASRSEPQATVAVGGDRLTFAWMNASSAQQTSINIAQTDLAGHPLIQPTTLATVPTAFATVPRVELAWDGQSYLVAWTTPVSPPTAKIHGLRLSFNGLPLDSQPFDLASDASSDFSLIALPTGFAMGYSLQAGTTQRAYMRTIDRPPLPGRHRPAR